MTVDFEQEVSDLMQTLQDEKPANRPAASAIRREARRRTSKRRTVHVCIAALALIAPIGVWTLTMDDTPEVVVTALQDGTTGREAERAGGNSIVVPDEEVDVESERDGGEESPPVLDGEERSKFISLTVNEASNLAEESGRSWRVVVLDGEAQRITHELNRERLNFVVAGGLVLDVLTDWEI